METLFSAKNPRPVCIPINRYFGVKMCVRLSNIYMSGRNIHACLDMEGFWDDESAFNYSFNCFRIGSNGVGLVSPEEGGGNMLYIIGQKWQIFLVISLYLT